MSLSCVSRSDASASNFRLAAASLAASAKSDRTDATRYRASSTAAFTPAWASAGMFPAIHFDSSSSPVAASSGFLSSTSVITRKKRASNCWPGRGSGLVFFAATLSNRLRALAKSPLIMWSLPMRISTSGWTLLSSVSNSFSASIALAAMSLRSLAPSGLVASVATAR